MPSKKRRRKQSKAKAQGRSTGSAAAARAVRSVVMSPLDPPIRASALETSRTRHPRQLSRFRPRWHKVVGIVLLVSAIGLAITNDMELLGGPHPPLPGGHNEAYLLGAIIVAAFSTWWFGWYDRARR